MKMLIENIDPQHDVALPYIAGEVLVKVQQGMIEPLALKLFMLGLNISKKLNLLAGDFIVVQSHSKSIFDIIELLNDLIEVEYAEPNYTNQHFVPKSETTLTLAKSPQSPVEKFAVKEAAIEMIDSQINLNSLQRKPEIKVNRKSGDFVEDITIRDLLFISNKVPVNLAEAVEAIDYATKREVNIISNSWVRNGFSRALDEALGIADKKGISFAAAAGIAATISTSLGAFAGHSPSPHNDFISTLAERRPAAHVSAGILSLYIDNEGKEEKTGRGRLIVKNMPSEEEIENAWNSASPIHSSGKPTAQKDIKISQDYSFPDAKFIKLEIETLDSSTNIDLIILRNANGVIINNISGSGKNYETDYIETNIITVEFTSNASSTSIGSIIRNVKVIY